MSHLGGHSRGNDPEDNPDSLENVLLFGMTLFGACRGESKCVWWGPLGFCEIFYVHESVSLCMFV